MSTLLNAAQRARFAALADVLAPAAEGMPAASAVDIDGALLSQVLNHRPDLGANILRVTSEAAAEPAADTIARLMRDAPELFQSLSLAVAAGYYLSPVVRQLIGYPGQERRPFDADAVPPYVANGMLERVRARGPIWRAAPERPGTGRA